MKNLALTLVLTAGAAWAQPGRPAEPLSGWIYFKSVQAPGRYIGFLSFLMDRDMLSAARTDASDVRLYDSSGHEIPYVLRVRREMDTSNAHTAREFNRSYEAGAIQASYDLGDQPQTHNEVEVDTAGNNFRRLVDVEGSADGTHWSTLVTGASIFRFSSAGRSAEQQAVAYPVSRYRYLRIRVGRDPQADESAPVLNAVRVRQAVRVRGEMTDYQAMVRAREPDRFNSRPASVWRVDLGGRVPVERVVVNAADRVFSRPFQLDAIDDPAAPELLASGQLVRTEDAPERRPTIGFPEHWARSLKLTVTDDRNPPLSPIEVTVSGSAREVIFEAASAQAGGVRAYYGNHRALAPHYDLAVRLPADPRPAPVRVSLGAEQDNPIYSPEPVPLSERLPWMVYLVLGAACAVLAGILLSLLKVSRAHDITSSESLRNTGDQVG